MHVSARSMEMTAVSAGSIQKILVEAAEVEPCRLPTMPEVSFERMRPILLVLRSGVCISAIVSLPGAPLRGSGQEVTVHLPGASKHKTCCSLCFPYVALDPIRLSAAISRLEELWQHTEQAGPS